jgi:hypothetical protein
VVFINRTGNSVSIPTGTRVSTSAGTPIVFQTTHEAQVPAGEGQQVEVAIEAIPEFSGEIGNVDVGLINTVIGDLAADVEVRNLAPTYAGESRTVRIVTQQDKDTLVAILRQQIQDRAFRDLAPQITESQFAILDTLRIAEERSDWLTFNYDVGDVTDTLTLTMQAIVEVIAVDEGLAEQIAYTRLGAQIPRGRMIRPESVVYDRGSVTNVEAGGRVTFTMVASALVVGNINVGQLQERLASRTPEDAMSYLLNTADLEENTTPQITISPDWLNILPILPMRINIRFTEAPNALLPIGNVA